MVPAVWVEEGDKKAQYLPPRPVWHPLQAEQFMKRFDIKSSRCLGTIFLGFYRVFGPKKNTTCAPVDWLSPTAVTHKGCRTIMGKKHTRGRHRNRG